MAILQNNDRVGEYVVQNLIKANRYTETYRVKDADGNLYFLKLFVANKVPSKLINQETQQVNEIGYCQQIDHRNLMAFVGSGQIEHESGLCQYYITNYCQGSILSDYIQTEGCMCEEQALKVFSSILCGLQYLHAKVPALCHNDVDPSNIMLSPVMNGEAVLIDYGHLSTVCGGIPHFDTSDLDPHYHGKETMVGIFEERGDIFSACAVLYYMLTGQAPWVVDVPEEGEYKERFMAIWQYSKSHPLNLDPLAHVSKKTQYIIERGLKVKAADRFQSVGEILGLLQSSDEVPPVETSGTKESGKGNSKASDEEPTASDPNDINPIHIEVKCGGGNGFKDVAGMHDLKKYLRERVILVIKDKELAEQYRITPPNGMLLYGPPGCGKTFLAEKFAEETGFNFMLVKASDIGSSFVHGSQEKIRKLFALAEKNSPIVLCFDEFDAVVPNRSGRGAEHVASEVNEFLAQMNNCSKRGIFIIATTNRPDMIDPAVRRTGRIDKHVYVPLPDLEARKEMFRLYLDRRPVADDLDFDAFATATEGYIASDIAFIVNDVAMTAAFARKTITNELMLTTIQQTKPSLNAELIKEYQEMRDQQDIIQRRVIVQGL